MGKKKATRKPIPEQIDIIDELFPITYKSEMYDRAIGDAEKTVIQKALKWSFGNQTIASKILGINRNTLRFKIKKLGINVRKFKI